MMQLARIDPLIRCFGFASLASDRAAGFNASARVARTRRRGLQRGLRRVASLAAEARGSTTVFGGESGSTAGKVHPGL